MATTTSTDITPPEVPARTRRRALVAGCIGNFMEWYDFALYGAFAAIIAANFFPGGGRVGGLLATYMVFVMAFLARPIGALVFGHIGDRFGRRQALASGIVLMAVVTAATGLLPPYSAIGWPAPALLALLRIGQGIAVGGEYGGSAAYVVEYARADRRGAYGGWQWATVALGFAGGIGAAVLLSAALPARTLTSWGWRAPFVLALPLGLIGVYIRTRLADTPGFRATQRAGLVAHTPLADALRTARRHVAIGFGVVAAITVTFNITFVFLPNHLVTSGRQLPFAFTAALAGLIVASVVAPVAGALSDRIGRRPVLLWCTTVLAVVIVPASSVIEEGSALGTLVAYLSLSVLLGALVPTTFLAELFSTRLRYSGLSLTFGLGSALLGGTAPVVATVLARQSGSVRSAAWYAAVVTAVAVACVLAAPETANRPLDSDEPDPQRADSAT